MSKGHPNPNKGRGPGIKWIREHLAHQGDDCLPWPFSRNNYGYGQLGYEGKIYKASRMMCELAHGPAPDKKMQAAHSCGNGHLGCCNPKHLSWKDNAGNQRDRRVHGTQKGAIGSRTRLTIGQIELIQTTKGIITQERLAAQLGVKRGTIEYWRRRANI